MAARPRVVVVGLGPAGPDLLTAGTRGAIGRVAERRLRTTRHPAASVLEGAPSYDGVYESEATFAGVYARIADLLAADAARHGEVLYAVPGSPRVLERSVDHLVADDRVDVEVLPALSFLDLAWVRLGVDPLDEGVRLVDGHRFAERAAGQRGPLLVAHCHNRRVLSDVKLAVDDPPSTPVVVLQRLGGPGEAVFEVPWPELDRSFEPDHLTSLYVPELAAPVAAEVERFADLVATLRRECPWDREQTHQSLTRHLLEEAYEVLEAIDALDPAAAGSGGIDPADEHLEEELGDLLFQVVFHATLARERGAFDLAGVARGIHAKLHARHPHVFGGAAASTADELARDWEERKRLEKGRQSVMDGIPSALPSLLYALQVVRKARSVPGAGWRGDGGVPLDGVTDAAAGGGGRTGGDVGGGGRDVGRRLLALVAEADALGVDPEAALRRAAARVRDEVRAAEVAAREPAGS
ncbi:MAG: hypothetical protein HYX34_14455 [Actinobacteria bacterium]|nr:hypothetical protein [Actinomycetota bacterium]